MHVLGCWFPAWGYYLGNAKWAIMTICSVMYFSMCLCLHSMIRSLTIELNIMLSITPWSVNECIFPPIAVFTESSVLFQITSLYHCYGNPVFSLHIAWVIALLSFSEQIHISVLPLLRFLLPTLLCGTFLRRTLSPLFDLSFIMP